MIERTIMKENYWMNAQCERMKRETTVWIVRKKDKMKEWNKWT